MKQNLKTLLLKFIENKIHYLLIITIFIINYYFIIFYTSEVNASNLTPPTNKESGWFCLCRIEESRKTKRTA
jgi:hypothetical protein